MKLPQTKTKELCIITLVQPRKDLFRELMFHLSILDIVQIMKHLTVVN